MKSLLSHSKKLLTLAVIASLSLGLISCSKKKKNKGGETNPYARAEEETRRVLKDRKIESLFDLNSELVLVPRNTAENLAVLKVVSLENTEVNKKTEDKKEGETLWYKERISTLYADKDKTLESLATQVFRLIAEQTKVEKLEETGEGDKKTSNANDRVKGLSKELLDYAGTFSKEDSTKFFTNFKTYLDGKEDKVKDLANDEVDALKSNIDSRIEKLNKEDKKEDDK